MKSFNIYTLGCKVNQYDSLLLGKKLISLGMKKVYKNADLAIVNTCAVTKAAISKDKRILIKARKENLKAKIAVIGCWPQVYKNEALAIGADFVCGKKGVDKLLKKISQLPLKQPVFSSCQNNKTINNKEKSRYFIKVQDGCEQYCSYCIIPYARGRLKSRGVKEIIKEVENAVRQGRLEIVVSGIHLGLYGKDFKNKRINLAGLLRELIKIKNLGRIRLSSIEVTEISAELIELFKTNKICPHFHIPLQSGSNRILKKMNRPYDRNFFKSIIRKLKKAAPDIALTTDIIVGFPGETDCDFKETKKFIKEINFSKLHIFPFSAHEKTPAAKMDKKVKKDLIFKRAKILRDLSIKLERHYKNKFKNRKLEVAVAAKVAAGLWKGRTEYSFDAEFKENQIVSPRNKILPGALIEIISN
jgi:threonylcarbamoyladenosine tRNA methylthiotransferase MtaB